MRLATHTTHDTSQCAIASTEALTDGARRRRGGQARRGRRLGHHGPQQRLAAAQVGRASQLDASPIEWLRAAISPLCFSAERGGVWEPWLAACWRARRNGARVTLFEKEQTCGGHTLTDDSSGYPVDLGFQVGRARHQVVWRPRERAKGALARHQQRRWGRRSHQGLRLSSLPSRPGPDVPLIAQAGDGRAPSSWCGAGPLCRCTTSPRTRTWWASWRAWAWTRSPAT